MNGIGEKLQAMDSAGAAVVRGALMSDLLKIKGRFTVECFGKNGELKWKDVIDNLVTTAGKNDILDKYLAGSAYTAAVVMGLKGTGSAAAGDVQSSHAGWLEVGGTNAPAYTGNRPTPSFAAAGSGTKATSAAVSFAITSAGTVAGCFINQGGSSTKDNTTGILVSAGDFSGGSKSVDNGDTLNVTYSLSL